MARTWKMRNILDDLRKTEKLEKFEKMSTVGLKKVENLENVHCRTWNMARKLKIMENEKTST